MLHEQNVKNQNYKFQPRWVIWWAISSQQNQVPTSRHIKGIQNKKEKTSCLLTLCLLEYSLSFLTPYPWLMEQKVAAAIAKGANQFYALRRRYINAIYARRLNGFGIKNDENPFLLGTNEWLILQKKIKKKKKEERESARKGGGERGKTKR